MMISIWWFATKSPMVVVRVLSLSFSAGFMSAKSAYIAWHRMIFISRYYDFYVKRLDYGLLRSFPEQSDPEHFRF